MNRRGDHTGRQERIGEFEQRVGAAIEAFVEQMAEMVQSVGGIGVFHNGAFCYRRSPEATLYSSSLPVQL